MDYLVGHLRCNSWRQIQSQSQDYLSPGIKSLKSISATIDETCIIAANDVEHVEMDVIRQQYACCFNLSDVNKIEAELLPFRAAN